MKITGGKTLQALLRESMSNSSFPKVLLIGGPDVDTRIELMRMLSKQCRVQAAGASIEIAKKFEKEGFPYHYYPLAKKVNPFSHIASLIALFLIIRKERPDIVHTFDTKPSILGRLAAKLCGVPIIIGTITGLGSLYIVQGKLLPALIRPVYQSIQKLLCKISDLTIFYTQDDVAFFLSKGIVKQSQIFILPGSGVMLERFSPDRFPEKKNKETRAEIGIPEGHIVVTMIARLVRSKGILLFADVARKIKAQIPATHFLLIGSHDMESLDSLSQDEIGYVCEIVQWIGHQQQIEDYLAITDIFVLPSEREGIPRVLVEAAAMKLPLVATDMPGCRDVVIDGSNGFLISPNDPKTFEQAIVELIIHPEIRHQFGMASRNYALEKFDLRKIATTLLGIYYELLVQKGIIR